MTNTETQTEAPATGNSLKNRLTAAQYARDLAYADAIDNKHMFVMVGNRYTAWAERVGYVED